MDNQLKYMPIFRGRQEEQRVLKTFDFGERIYPCVEIIMELDRLPPKPRKNAKPKTPSEPKKEKSFEDVYIPMIASIKANKVFVDFPTHLKPDKKMKHETLNFITTVITKRAVRTDYIRKFKPIATKVIPVISTYSEITGERNSITVQVNELRGEFNTLAFRTFLKTFSNDIKQIRNSVQPQDYLIMDWEDLELDIDDGDQQDVIDELAKLRCTVIVHRNSYPKEITNVGLEHGKIVPTIDNSLMTKYINFGGTCFSDYAGIKKDNIGDGGVISPGFVYYDAVRNNFYGFRFKYGSHRKGETPPDLEEFETTIVPDVIGSESTKTMNAHQLDFLGMDNFGWQTILNINSKKESGKNAGKFKRIAMEHYLHCIKMKVLNGDFA